MGEPRRASKTEQAHLVVVDGHWCGGCIRKLARRSAFTSSDVGVRQSDILGTIEPARSNEWRVGCAQSLGLA